VTLGYEYHFEGLEKATRVVVNRSQSKSSTELGLCTKIDLTCLLFNSVKTIKL
jgi:hypothetical protein